MQNYCPMKTATFSFIFFLFSNYLTAQLNIEKPRIKIQNGIVEGMSISGISVSKGIPFAAPPVGELRWKEPQAVRNWDGILKAVKFGPSAMQLPIYADMVFRSDTMSEDCLYLNVWTPAKSTNEKLPVLLYFYGGGYRAGDGSEPRYDGESMTRHGIVAVTVNYRLGVFGFMAHPELSAETDYKGSGNYALMDQYAALKWVQENIDMFGGDPARITIAGESCGSRSVCAQMASPKSRNLFSAAIGESGALMNSTIVPLSLEEAEELGIQFIRLAGKNSIDELRALSAQELLELSSLPGAPYFPPNIDHYFLPDFPSRIFESGDQAKVPLLVGWNSEEMNYRFIFRDQEPTLANYINIVKDLYADHAEEAMLVYKANSDEEVKDVATDLAGDRFSGFNTWKWLELHRQTGRSPVYRYYYSRPRPLTGTQTEEEQTHMTGAVHSAEIDPHAKRYHWLNQLPGLYVSAPE